MSGYELTTAAIDNVTSDNVTLSNQTMSGQPDINPLQLVFAMCYVLICGAGIVGNGLVIFVVLRYAKMKTVTNIYILNLAISDLCFLVGLPFLIVTVLLRQWVFGHPMCKIFYILTSINWYTSVFLLIVMSADRYLAVCHPVRSMSYRTPLKSRIICIIVWLASMVVMIPIMLYSEASVGANNHVSCTIIWPEGQVIAPDKAFIWYSLLLGFAIPCALISVFYTLVVLRLRTVGPKTKSKEMKRSHRKVTKMVLTVITVYIICWLPYWVFQIVSTFREEFISTWAVYLFQVITILSYTNSMLNPLLYAFFSENFRKTFVKAFKCASADEVNGTLQVEHSLFPGRRSAGQTALSTSMATTKIRLTNADEDIDALNANDKDHKPDEASELQPLSGYEQEVFTSPNHRDMETQTTRPTAV